MVDDNDEEAQSQQKQALRFLVFQYAHAESSSLALAVWSPPCHGSHEGKKGLVSIHDTVGPHGSRMGKAPGQFSRDSRQHAP